MHSGLGADIAPLLKKLVSQHADYFPCILLNIHRIWKYLNEVVDHNGINTSHQGREGERSWLEKLSSLSNLLFIQRQIKPQCTIVWIIRWKRCQPVYIYLLHINSIPLTHCEMVLVKDRPKTMQIFLACIVQARGSWCLPRLLFVWG